MEAINIRADEDQLTSELPEDLVFYDILSQLPPKTLMRFKSVSQAWRTRVSTDLSFIDAHQICQETKTGPLLIGTAERNDGEETMMLLSEQTSKAKEVEASYVLKGKGGLNTMDSCNGLVCMSLGWPRVVVLWNPATRQQRELPRPTVVSTTIFPDGGLGFGFDVTSKDFKVVQLSRDKTSSEEGSLMHAHVFARSGTAWRECKTSLRISEDILWMHDAVAVEGVLCWTVLTKSGQHIVSFDLRDEVLRLAHPPVDCGYSLCKWNNSLAVYTHYSETEKIMWASTYSDGVRHWNKIFPATISERNFELPENFKLQTSIFDFPNDRIRMRRDYVESIASVF